MQDKQISERSTERLQQERETFEEHKKKQRQWFTLQLVMGYAALALLAVMVAVSSYIVIKVALFPDAAVVVAAVTLVGDSIALVVGLWKIVLNPQFVTGLAPTIQMQDVESTTENHSEDSLFIHEGMWGRDDSSRNVTETLRSKIREGRLEIRATGEALELTPDDDPAPNIRKQLSVIYSHAGKTTTKVVDEDHWLSLP
jgi:hypothetical protein